MEMKVVQLTEAVEYAECISAEGSDVPLSKCPGYDTYPHRMVRLPSWKRGKCVELLNCHYFQIHSDRVVEPVKDPSMGQTELFNHLL